MYIQTAVVPPLSEIFILGQPGPFYYALLFFVVTLRQAADFRKGYGNWRSKKSKGARGETNYLTDKDKLHATDAKHEEVS